MDLNKSCFHMKALDLFIMKSGVLKFYQSKISKRNTIKMKSNEVKNKYCSVHAFAMLFWIFSNFYFLKISRPPIWQFETEHFLSGLLKLKLETVNQWCSHKWCRACIHYKFLFRILWKFQKTPISWSEDRVLSYGNKSMSL